MTYMDDSLAKIEFFEGKIPWMYKDTVGLVTVGVGHMLPNATAACALPFRYASGSLASDADITSAYSWVSSQPSGRVPSFYHPTSGVTLDQGEIESLLRMVNVANDKTLSNFIPGYDDFPASVKLALLDMTYNLGWNRLSEEYPHFLAAVKSRNWTLAATECHRNGPSDARNQWTKQMFTGAQ